MFIGHYAPALLVAAGARGPHLGAMFVAAQLVDIAFFSLALVDVEHFRLIPADTPQTSLDLYHMPYTHSLLGTVAFASLWVGVVRLAGAGWRAAALGAAVVVSHWLFDLVVHVPDLTLAGQPPRLGLGLWRSPVLARTLEGTIVIGAFAWYLARTRGAMAPAAILAATMLVVQAIDWLGSVPARIVDPVAPTLPVMALFAFILLAILAWWTGRTRARGGPAVTRL